MKRTSGGLQEGLAKKSLRVTNRLSYSIAEPESPASSPRKSIIDPTKLTNLCLSCAKIRFKDFFAESNPNPIIILRQDGNVSKIQASRLSCTFCKFIAEIIRVFSGSVGDAIITDQKKISIVRNTSGKPWYRFAGIDAELENLPTAWLQFGSSRSPELIEPRICLSQFEKNVCNHSLPRTKPAVEAISGLINYELVLSWIDICLKSHASDCGRSTNFKRQLLSIKLIDVASREVVLDTRKAPYVALSYVWGEPPFVNTAFGPMAELGSLNTELRPSESIYKLPKVLPRTVEDALSCVWALGMRYLWIDRYCIDQSNKGEMQAQIENMDLVYECADLTLIALDGKDMNSGLAGISRPLEYTEQPIFENEGIHLMATCVDSMWDRQGTTPWDQRGWTFQESVLSRRCLYFDRSHIFLRCQEEMFHDVMEVDQHQNRKKTDQSDDLFWENGFGLNVQQVDWSFATFDVFLANYTRREFRNQSEVLNACKGLFNQITRNTGVSFLWGLPLSDFSRALLWRPHHETCIEERNGFPSWSWTGWKGRVEYSYWLDEMDGYAEEVESKVRLNVIAAESSKGALFCPTAERDKWDRVVRNDEAFLQTKGMSETGGFSLRVSSTVAQFKLQRVRRQYEVLKHVTKDMQQEKKAQGDQWTLLDRLGNPLVNEVGDHTWFERTDYFFHLLPAYSERLQGLKEAAEFLFIKYWPAIRDQHEVGSWRFNMVSALLISRREDQTATRLASVVMKLEDWIAADPQPVIVDLV